MGEIAIRIFVCSRREVSEMRAAVAVALSFAVTPAHAQDIGSPPIAPWTRGAESVLNVGPNCSFFETRVNQSPLIDWICAEKFADLDGPGYNKVNEIARALIAVRDHKYEERK